MRKKGLTYDWHEWSIVLSTIDIIDHNIEFTVKFGYVPDETGIYIRVWDGEGEFVGGSWLKGIVDKEENISLNDKLTGSFVSKCVEHAARLERLKVFA